MTRRCFRSQRGQATVELALLLPVVLMLGLVVLQIVLFARDTTTTIHAINVVARAVAVDADAATAQRVLNRFDEPVRSAQLRFSGAIQRGEIAEVTLQVEPTRVPIVGMMMGSQVIKERLVFYIEPPVRE